MFPSRRRVTTLLFGSALTLGGLTAGGCGAPADAATAPPARRSAPPPDRHVPLHGAVNCRDLGGYRTEDGRQLRSGRLFRSDALAKLTPADVTALGRLGLRTVIDMRVTSEISFDGADRLPTGLAVTSLPVDDTGLFAAMQAAIATKDPVEQQRRLGDGKAEALMRAMYPTFVTNAADRAAFGALLTRIADGDRLPLLYHCTSGKDRTGWLSYLLLRLLGVPHTTALRDYLLSNALRRDADAAVRAQLKQAGLMQNPDLLIPLQEVRTGYLAAGLTRLQRDYGGIPRYLSAGLGVDAHTAARIRAQLLH
ncbi:tyrosine-protein phosphatase [Streptomyces yunnanensis]|uniref:Tyrosine-protein phosphatase n=1 Tax=Streptomyces yunnanensis TaxID=156453 RepID=A0ABY8A196_9ACTN|nr:tyrosine-protein phosphatase [Streptomyces yunnanensis]WEB38693.1 tyrosine-protein phosphatase [Streptomyces yunnanensis]